MKKWNNTYIIDKGLKANIKGYNFAFVPYVPPGRFMDALNTIDGSLNDFSAIFCHQEFYGAKMGAIISQSGDIWDINKPLIISGHIHDYDRLQNNIIYVGTPIQHAFGDKSDKTVSEFSFNNTTWSEKRKDLGLIKRVIIYLTPQEIHTYNPPTNKLVKIVIRGDESEIKAIAKLEKIKILKKTGVKIVFKIINNNTTNYKKGPVLKMTYIDRLYSEICKDKDQLKWFNLLCK